MSSIHYVSSREGKGSLVGLLLDKHWDAASVQALYSFETPFDGSEYGIHRAGLDEKTAKILNAKAIASRQTPSEIIASLLRKELTVAHV